MKTKLRFQENNLNIKPKHFMTFIYSKLDNKLI